MTEDKKWKPQEKPVQGAVAGKDYSLAPVVATKEAVSNNRALMVKSANAYLKSGIVSNFSLFPLFDKMSLFSRTPKAWIKYRQVGGLSVPYVPGELSMKLLNYIFAFDISLEISDIKLIETKVQTKNGPKTAYQAAVTVKFTLHDPRSYRDITRMFRSSHQGFASPATTPDDFVKAAITKSWTLCAKSFGLLHDIKDTEKEEEIEQKVEAGTVGQPAEKDFSFN